MQTQFVVNAVMHNSDRLLVQHVNITLLCVLGNHEICVIRLVAVYALLHIWNWSSQCSEVCLCMPSLQSSFIFIIHNNLVRERWVKMRDPEHLNGPFPDPTAGMNQSQLAGLFFHHQGELGVGSRASGKGLKRNMAPASPVSARS